MIFKYFIASKGWAHLEVQINQYKAEPFFRDKLAFGDLCSLGHLLEGIIRLLNNNNSIPIDCVQNNEKSNSMKWTVSDETFDVNFIFDVSENRDKANLRITKKLSYSPYKEECFFDGEVDFIELAREVLHSCEEILSKHGIIGYFANTLTGRDFPIAYYLLLKNFFDKTIDNIETSYVKLESDECDGSDVFFTKLNQELEILKKCGRIA